MNLNVQDGKEYDLIVVGGGPSGAVAAIAAARLGVKVMLVEQCGYLGGALTAMGVGPMMSFHNRAGEHLVKGIAQEVVDRLKLLDASPGHVADSTTYCSTVTPFDSETLKIVLEEMVLEAGGEILFHSQLAAVETNCETMTSVVLCNKSGLVRYLAGVFVDATGDGDLAKLAGAPYIMGDGHGLMQPMTMNLKLNQVDTAAIRQYAIENPENFRFTFGAEEGLRRLRSTPRISLAGYLKEWEEAVAGGEVDVPREFILFFETAREGEVIVNTSRLVNLDPTNPEELSRAEREGRRQCTQIFNVLRRRCKGFEHACRVATSSKIGVRESRHIQGLYQLTGEDLLEEKHFEDPILLGGYPVDVHSPTGKGNLDTHMAPDVRYQVPLRSLIATEPRNLVLAGRCISADQRGCAAVRVTPIMMAVGQASGTVAALAARDGITPADVPYGKVREELLRQGAFLGCNVDRQTPLRG